MITMGPVMEASHNTKEGFVEALVLFTIWWVVASIAMGWILIAVTPIVMSVVSLLAIKQCFSSTLEAADCVMESDCVLVVDDDYDTVMPLLKLLEAAKVPFKYVTGGVEAIRELSSNRFRLIFMDKNMPALDGFETLERADVMMENRDQAIPVVFFTGTYLMERPLKLAHMSIVQTWNKSMGILNLKTQLNQLLACY